MQHTVYWLGFCISGTLQRSILHFAPSSKGIAAPYPTSCKLTLFSNEGISKSVTLDGSRLGQPDGLWIDYAFKFIRDKSGLYGLLVELHAVQPRVDLDPSSCLIEVSSNPFIATYRPARLNADGVASASGAAPIVIDPFMKSSLVVVNGSNCDFEPRFKRAKLSSAGDSEYSSMGVGLSKRGSIVEHEIEPEWMNNALPLETSFGLFRSGGISWDGDPPPGVVAYILYREPSQGTPLSVCAL